MSNIPKIAGMVWYRREEYEAIIAMMEDARKLPRSFESWHSQAKANEKRAQLDGFSVVRAFIDPSTFPNWCHTRGLSINSEARQIYANSVAMEAAKNFKA